MPRVNTLLLVGVLLLVLMFRSSSALASAYGIAVTGTMVVTGMHGVRRDLEGLALVAARGRGADAAVPAHRPRPSSAPICSRSFEGGWVPLALGGLVMVMMYTWRRGSRLLFEKTRRQEMPLDDLVRMLERKPPRPRAGHGGVPHQRPATARRPRCCTASSTTRCCTRRTSS